jgi:hypothetical protein
VRSNATKTRGAAASAAGTKTRNASSSAGTAMGMSGVAGLITSGLASSFEALRDKVSDTVTENGEEYLKDGVQKIARSTKDLVAWGKKHPLKTAAAVAALLAVSGFLVHVVRSKGGASTAPKRKARTSAAARG